MRASAVHPGRQETARCVRDVLDVEIPGERSHNSLVLPEFLKVKKQIMDMLWQESNDAAMDR